MSLNLNIWGMFSTNQVQMEKCSRKVASRRRVAGAILSLVNARDLQLECARVLHETLLVPVLCMAVRQCYGRRRRDLELGLCRGKTSEDRGVLGEWIE